MSPNDANRTPRRSLTPRIAAALSAAALVVAGSLSGQTQMRRSVQRVSQRPALMHPASSATRPYGATYLRAPELVQAPQQVRRRPAPVVRRQPPPARPQAARPQPAPAAPPAPQARSEHEIRPAQNVQSQAVAPLQPRPTPNTTANAPTSQLVSPNHPAQTQQHLANWMEAHRTLPLAEQQRALDSENGFRELPPQEQQQLHQQLTRLNAMPPEQRARQQQKIEYMERLAPAQRRQVNTVMAQLGSLPEYRQHVVGRTFYQLRDMPPAQRQVYMNSPQFRSQFSDQERGTIDGLLTITPIWPPIQAQQPPH